MEMHVGHFFSGRHLRFCDYYCCNIPPFRVTKNDDFGPRRRRAKLLITPKHIAGSNGTHIWSPTARIYVCVCGLVISVRGLPVFSNHGATSGPRACPHSFYRYMLLSVFRGARALPSPACRSPLLKGSREDGGGNSPWCYGGGHRGGAQQREQ